MPNVSPYTCVNVGHVDDAVSVTRGQFETLVGLVLLESRLHGGLKDRVEGCAVEGWNDDESPLSRFHGQRRQLLLEALLSALRVVPPESVRDGAVRDNDH